MTPLIQSLLETDLYKFTMWQAMLHRHPQAQAEYRFVCRNASAFALAGLADEVNAQLDALCALRFTEAELAYLGGLRFMQPDFIDFLRDFRFQRQHIRARAQGDALEIVASGPQVQVTGFEIPVLALVNGLYFRRQDTPAVRAEGRARLRAKVDLLRALARDGAPHRHPFEFFDFGIRRRFAADWQEEVLRTLQREVPQYFKGTSNVHLARRLGLTPIGTMAHEYLQSYQAYGVRLRDFQKAALTDWMLEYRGDLAIALTDVVGMDAFLSDFDPDLSQRFTGLRHDSGDPVAWGEKALAHYARLGIDAHDKRLVFSDGLDLPTALRLYHHFADRTRPGFGIGTSLTNDLGLTPLNIVMKLVRCNHQVVAKLSDAPGKSLCDDPAYLDRLRQTFQVSA